jgi:hypothetical protein
LKILPRQSGNIRLPRPAKKCVLYYSATAETDQSSDQRVNCVVQSRGYGIGYLSRQRCVSLALHRWHILTFIAVAEGSLLRLPIPGSKVGKGTTHFK